MYLLGHLFYDTYGQRVITLLHGGDVTAKAEVLFHENVFMAQFLASLTPLPDRVFSFLAGAFLVSPFIIFVATFLGRLVRIAPVAYLSYEYGDEARFYIKKHTKTVMYVVFGFVICFILYSYAL
jgi:membrane protein YqaA with SNARE-associated domain